MTSLNESAIKAFTKRIYDGLPEKIKPCFNPLLSGYRKFRLMYLPVFLFSGETKTNGISFTFAYVGTNLNQQNFWSRLILGPEIDKTFLGNHFAFDIPTLLRKSYPQCAMMLWEDSPVATVYFNNKAAFRIPKWIPMEIDISLPLDALCRGNHAYKDIRRKINKYHYTYSKTQKPGDYEYFYDTMYVVPPVFWTVS